MVLILFCHAFSREFFSRTWNSIPKAKRRNSNLTVGAVNHAKVVSYLLMSVPVIDTKAKPGSIPCNSVTVGAKDTRLPLFTNK
jgi:hypothetical protein